MSERNKALKELGLHDDFTTDASKHMNGCIGSQAFTPMVPSFSAYGEFTPISVRSYTVARNEDADMESDQRRD
jgi:hypothetical protein